MVKRTTLAIVSLSIVAILGWGLARLAGVETGLLEVENEALKSSYNSLNATHNELREDYYKLAEDYATLKSNHTALSLDYETLSWKYKSLNTSYNELITALEKGEAIAESSTWLSEDERLEVTSELIPEYYSWSGEISGYNVKVTVTNIGDQPLDVVWIFLFPYVDGKLYEYWGPISYSHSVESLYMGETYSYTFTWVTADMTSYRVLAIAG